MKLTIKNFKSLKDKSWDSKNYIESVNEYDATYEISCWRDYLRKTVILKREPDLNGCYVIGMFDSDTHSIRYPYWISLNDIQDQTTFMQKLKLITDWWQIKMI